MLVLMDGIDENGEVNAGSGDEAVCLNAEHHVIFFEREFPLF